MIVFAFSALGLQGKGQVVTPWFVDPGASNHMTGSLTLCITFDTILVHNIFKLLMGVPFWLLLLEALDPLLIMFFFYPGLSTNLTLVGQLVDNNFDVSLLLAVFCGFGDRGRWSRRGLKLEDCFHYSLLFILLRRWLVLTLDLNMTFGIND